jgi:hypothetical protein
MIKVEIHVRHVFGKGCGWDKTFILPELKFKGKVEPNLRITTADWQPPQQS